MEPRTLALELGERSYDILIGNGLLDQVGRALLEVTRGRQAAIVTNSTVAPLYLDRVTESLRQAGFSVASVILPDGEAYKDFPTLHTIYDVCIERRFERSSLLVALGGGVVGDMTGFAAATLLRGVAFVQVPTTLLAQVDSSVGGKTGINHPLGKNLIGSFYQPKRVFIDVETLSTLPRRELLSGLAEVIKYGVIRDERLFGFLEERLERILNLEQESIAEVIHTCCAIKAEVVAADEREGGVRALLNLGHTFGHAIEKLAGYGEILHGEAVAVGMVMAADLSQRIGLCPEEDAQRLRQLIQHAGLPVTAPRFPVARYLETMARDKKVEGGKLRFVLFEGIGRGVIRGEIPTDAVAATLEACMG